MAALFCDSGSRGSALLRFLVDISPKLQGIKINDGEAGAYRLVVDDKKSPFTLTELRTIVQYFGYLQNIHDVASAKDAQFVDIACSILEGDTTASSLSHLNEHLTRNSFAAGDISVADYALAFAVADLLKSAKQAQFSSVFRWYDQIQNAGLAAAALPRIDIPLPSLTQSYGTFNAAVAAAAVPAAVSVSLETKQSEPAPAKQPPAAAKPAKAGANGGNKKNQNKKNNKKDKKAKAKANKKAQAKPKGGGAATDLFAELDIRVGKIISATKPETSDKVLTEVIDCGDESGPRTIASGLVGHYTPDQLAGKLVVVLCNLKPRAMKFIAPDYASHGMVMCASAADKSKVELLQPPEGAQVGERVTFTGLPAAPIAKPNRVEKKGCFRKRVQFLKTSADRVAMFKDHPFTTSAGPITAPTLAGANIA